MSYMKYGTWNSFVLHELQEISIIMVWTWLDLLISGVWVFQYIQTSVIMSGCTVERQNLRIGRVLKATVQTQQQPHNRRKLLCKTVLKKWGTHWGEWEGGCRNGKTQRKTSEMVWCKKASEWCGDVVQTLDAVSQCCPVYLQ